MIIAGINPKTKECCLIGLMDDKDVVEEVMQGKLIAVPVTVTTARQIFGMVIHDIYDIAAQGEE